MKTASVPLTDYLAGRLQAEAGSRAMGVAQGAAMRMAAEGRFDEARMYNKVATVLASAPPGLGKYLDVSV